jgi:hypothetical protein
MAQTKGGDMKKIVVTSESSDAFFNRGREIWLAQIERETEE